MGRTNYQAQLVSWSRISSCRQQYLTINIFKRPNAVFFEMSATPKIQKKSRANPQKTYAMPLWNAISLASEKPCAAIASGSVRYSGAAYLASAIRQNASGSPWRHWVSGQFFGSAEKGPNWLLGSGANFCSKRRICKSSVLKKSTQHLQNRHSIQSYNLNSTLSFGHVKHLGTKTIEIHRWLIFISLELRLVFLLSNLISKLITHWESSPAFPAFPLPKEYIEIYKGVVQTSCLVGVQI